MKKSSKSTHTCFISGLQKLELERKQQELNAVIHELNKKKKEALLMAAAAQKQSSYVYQNENLCIVNKHKKPTVIPGMYF